MSVLGQTVNRVALALWCLSLFVAFAPGGVRAQPLVISEFVAANSRGLRDEDLDFPDWIELHHTGSSPFDAAGLYLTDDPATLAKWRLPSMALSPDRYVVVFASGKDRAGDGGALWHTNFRLSRNRGSYLALVAADGRTIISEFREYPEQRPDVSYGISGESVSYFRTPTPGSANRGAFPGYVADLRFSHVRGFHDEPFSLLISTETPEAQILYTVDGSEPGAPGGRIASGPITISRTTIVRAAAFRSGWEPSPVATQSYLFLDSILEQPADPRGYPTNWGVDSEVGLVPSDYQMDPRVVDGFVGGVQQTHSVADALLDIPTLSVVGDPDAFFGSTRGIYIFPKNRGDAWERPVSIELIRPDGAPGFQADCGARIQGNSSRRPFRMQKHSFRLDFREALGPARLEYPWIPGATDAGFNKIVLRACFTDSWGLVSWTPSRYRPDDSQYLRDVWMKDSHLDMGHTAARSTFAHLYINGLYWGLYNPCERLDAAFMSDYLGGERDGWDIVHDGGIEIRSGTRAAWDTLHQRVRNGFESLEEYRAVQGRNPDGTPSADLPNLLDVTSLADYMLLHFFAHAEDWPHNNWYAARPRDGRSGFRFFVWDQEIALDNPAINRIDRNESDKPSAIFAALRRNADFRMLFADRVQKHLFNEGALTVAACQDRYREWAARIDRAIVAESARWGDVSRAVPFTRDTHWIAERNIVVNQYIPSLTDTAMRRFRAAGLYPDVDPPRFSRRGGSVPAGFELEILPPSGSGGDGEVWFTTDGSDPRAPESDGAGSGLRNEILLVREHAGLRLLVPTRANDGDGLAHRWTGAEEPFPDATWTRGRGAVGYDTDSDYTDFIGSDVLEEMRNRQTSVYIRIPFDVNPDHLDGRNAMVLSMRYDDGFAAFLNGTQIAAANAPDPLLWDSSATTSNNDQRAAQFETFDVSRFLPLLRPGANVLAIHGLNVQTTSTDMLISPELRIGSSNDPSTRTTDGARRYSEPLVLEDLTTVRARLHENGEWSALNEVSFTVGEPLLEISELHYHPAPPTDTERAAGFDDADDFEFLELRNAGDTTATLAGLRFVAGIDFDFADATVDRLAPGGFAVLAANRAAFEFRYGSTAAAMVIGVYGASGTKFSNGGEEVALADDRGRDRIRFTYADRRPWPERADGDGPSLTLIATGLDPSDPTSWRAEAGTAPSPGRSAHVDRSVVISSIGRVGNALRIEFAADADTAYLVRRTDRLMPVASDSWTTVRRIEPAAIDGPAVVDVSMSPSATAEFYRIERDTGSAR